MIKQLNWRTKERRSSVINKEMKLMPFIRLKSRFGRRKQAKAKWALLAFRVL